MAKEISTQGYRLNPGDEEARKFDQFAHAVTTIEELHRLTHDGMVYHTSAKVLSLADAGVYDILIAVPAGTFPHFQRLQLTVGRGDVDIDMYEGTTTSADGTVVGSFNVNRNSTNTASTVTSHTPTITGDGTQIHTQWLAPTATGVGGSVPAGIVGETNGEEWVLKPNTKYLIRVTNNSGATINFRYEMLFYEISYEE
jgi:hypothetical protein